MTKKVVSNHPSSIIKLPFLILVSLLLTGCGQWTRAEQSEIVEWGRLTAAQTIGQTFVAEYDGLEDIYFYLSPQVTGNGEVRLHLRSDPQAVDDLALSSNTIMVDAVKAPGYYGFIVPTQESSNQKYYYAFLELTGSGELQVGKAAGDAYLDGAYYQDGTPEDAQAAFQLNYSRLKSIQGLGGEFVNWGGILAVGFFLFILPGWGLFNLLWHGWADLTWPEKMGLSAGLSLAIYPLLLLWTDILGLHLGAIYAWLPPIAGLGMLLWRNRKQLSLRPFQKGNPLNVVWADVAFIGIVVLIVFTRFWVIRSSDVPMWGDSYQHTMIAQLLVDHGGLFTSWQPYADLVTFTYHFGFHSAAAVFDWITGLEMSKAVLWTGQILNLLAVFVLYPLATKVGRNRWAGVVAVLMAGLFLPMPMFYTNWGRYTQLAGQVILPVTVWVMWNILSANSYSNNGRGRSKGMLTIAWITLAGLAVTHYRVLIIALIFLITLWIFYARRATIRSMFMKTLWIGAGAGLLFLPWFMRVFGGRILKIFAYQMSTSAKVAVEVNPQLSSIGNLFFYLPAVIWFALLMIIGFGIWRREKGIALISIWWFASFLIANPSWFGLPGSGALDSFTILIATYIPASVLVGAAIVWLYEFIAPSFKLRLKNKTAFSLGVVILFIGICFFGVRQRLNEIQPAQFSLATRPDILAAKWIEEHTAPDARLLVNSFPAFNDSVIVGSDGGWWLPLLAHRQTNLPPLNYGFDQGPNPDYIHWVNSLTFEIKSKGVTHSDVLVMLQKRGINYVYIGQRQGGVNYGGPLLLDPDQLLSSSNFRLVYHQDRVWIFNIQQVP